MKFASIPASIPECIDRYTKFILLGHEHPDADCLCSQLGLAALLTRLGKEVRLLAKGPFSRPEIQQLETLFETTWSYPDPHGTILVLMDFSVLERSGFPVEELAVFKRMIIDHHSAECCNEKNSYIDSSSPSTTLLVQNLWNHYRIKPDKKTCEYLFFGFATDTGFFRHLNQDSAACFKHVSALIEGGASPNQTFHRIHSGRKLGTRRLMGRILERSRFFLEDRIILSWEDKDDREELGAEDRDSNNLYQLLQSVSGCEAVALIREESRDFCIIGLRSNNYVDVGLIARKLGGGGHVKAAGCVLKTDRKTAQKIIVDLFREQLLGLNSPAGSEM